MRRIRRRTRRMRMRMMRRRRRRSIAHPSLNLGAGWGWLANTTPRPLNSRVKPRYQSVLSTGFVTPNVTILPSFVYSICYRYVSMSFQLPIFFSALIKLCDNLKQRNGHKIRDNFNLSCEISGFRHEADENCALLGYYTAYSGNSFPAFREKLQESKKILDSLRNYQYTLRHGPGWRISLRLSYVPAPSTTTYRTVRKG